MPSINLFSPLSFWRLSQPAFRHPPTLEAEVAIGELGRAPSSPMATSGKGWGPPRQGDTDTLLTLGKEARSRRTRKLLRDERATRGRASCGAGA